MGVTVIGGSSSSSSGLNFLPDASTIRFKPNFSNNPLSVYTYNYQQQIQSTSHFNLAPAGLTAEYVTFSVGTHNGSTATFSVGSNNSTYTSNFTVALTTINSSSVYWIGSQWLTNSNILICTSDSGRYLYVEEYDLSTEALASGGISITVDRGASANYTPSSNENNNKFGLLPNGNYFAKANNISSVFNSSGTLVSNFYSGSAIPVNNTDAFFLADDSAKFVRMEGSGGDNFQFDTGSGANNYMPFNSYWLNGFLGTGSSSFGGAVYDGYISLTENYQIHYGDLATWVSSVLDAAKGEGL